MEKELKTTYNEKNFDTLAKNLKNNIARRKLAKTTKQNTDDTANQASQSNQQ